MFGLATSSELNRVRKALLVMDMNLESNEKDWYVESCDSYLRKDMIPRYEAIHMGCEVIFAPSWKVRHRYSSEWKDVSFNNHHLIAAIKEIEAEEG